MPMPIEYQLAAPEFERFLRDVIEASGLATRNQAYTMVQGVFQVFRRRLDVRDAVRFADILPAMLRAIFVSDWDTDEPKCSFESRDLMTEEARSLRQWEGKVDERDVGRVLGQEHVEDIQKDRQVDENGDRRPCEADFQARYQPGLPNIPKEKQRRRHGTGDAGHRDQAFEQRAIALPDAEQDESDQERRQPQDESVTGNPFPAHVILRRVPAINLVEAYQTTLSCIKFGGLQGCLQVAPGYARPLATKAGVTDRLWSMKLW